MENIFFDNWNSVFRIIIITVLAYVALIVLLRSSGKRTLSKMNAFDFIITVALGSAFATVALTKSIPLFDGVLAFFLFIFLQYVISWLSVRISKIKQLVTSRPSMLLYQGELYHDILKKERITVDEIHMAARQKGITDLKEIDVMVLETTGDITIIQKTMERLTTLQSVKYFKE